MSNALQIEIDRLVGPARGERTRWLLARLAGNDDPVSLTELRDLLGPAYRQPERVLSIIVFYRQRLGDHEATRVDLDDDGVLEVEIRDAKARVWMLRCQIGAEAPHRLEFWSLRRPLPAGVRIRLAAESDAEAIAAVERSCPIERDDGSRVTLVRGRSLFDQMRLAEWGGIWIVEDDGAAIACDARSAHGARVGGRDVLLVYRFHTRVLPSHRRLGLNETLAVMLSEEQLRAGVVADGIYVYIDPGNQVIREWSPTPPWRERPLRALLRCDAVAGPPVGRRATRGDVPRIVELLNSAHGREELYRPWDSDRFASRLARVPERYGVEHVWLDDVAVVGIWEDREQRILEHDGERAESVRATVLDWGFASDAGDGLASLERLLRARCADLARRGVTHLSLFVAKPSPAAPLVRSLAESIVEVELQCTIEEPVDSPMHGVYVDPVYY